MIYSQPSDVYYYDLFKKQTDLENRLKNYLVHNGYFIKSNQFIKTIESETMSIEPIVLLGLEDLEDEIPPFTHPYYSETNKWAAMDFRPFVTVDKMTKKIRIRNLYDFALTVDRFILSSIWRAKGTREIYTLKFAHDVFANWLSDTISKKFGLEPQDQLRLKTLCAIYYACLFENNPSDEMLDKLIIRYKKDMFLTDEVFREVYRSIKNLDTINDFCENCYEVTGNMRLKGFNYTVLMNIIQTNWLSVNGKEILFTAIEHPPTWAAIVYGALNIRSFSKSYIANIAEKVSKRGAGEEFNIQYSAIVNQYKDDEVLKKITT